MEAIKLEGHLGRLAGYELWVATDNSTAEAAFHKGCSTSEALDEMVLQLLEEGIHGNFIVHLFHIAGTQMIELGIDEASQGKLQLGALLPTQGPAIVPLHLGALEHLNRLLEWVQSWVDTEAKVASPANWFHQAQQVGEYSYPLQSQTWIWAPPPAATLDAIEEAG